MQETWCSISAPGFYPIIMFVKINLTCLETAVRFPKLCLKQKHWVQESHGIRFRLHFRPDFVQFQFLKMAAPSSNWDGDLQKQKQKDLKMRRLSAAI